MLFDVTCKIQKATIDDCSFNLNQIFYHSFFKNFLEDHWYPCFGHLHSDSKPKRAALFTLRRCVHVTHSLRFTSGVTPADHLASTMAAEPISSTYFTTLYIFNFVRMDFRIIYYQQQYCKIEFVRILLFASCYDTCTSSFLTVQCSAFLVWLGEPVERNGMFTDISGSISCLEINIFETRISRHNGLFQENLLYDIECLITL